MNSNDSIIIEDLNNTLALCLQNLTDIQSALSTALLGTCVPDEYTTYDTGLHVAAVFIILVASLLGAGLPIFLKYHPGLNLDPFYIMLGKCMGIGVILACSLVHMLQPASQSLIASCLPYEFNTDYTAYAFLFCMLAIIGMHLFDYSLETYMMRKLMPDYEFDEEEKIQDVEKPMKLHDELEHGHIHSVLLIKGVKKTISAYLLEFGVTVHSVFIGLENGIVGEEELKGLLVALCFHQFFEGIALGSRIADATLPSHWHEFFLSLVFSLAAPLGIAAGIAVTTSIQPSGATFLLVEGTFDSVCAGILLYIGMILLLKDFPEDMKKYCGKNSYRKAGMFIFLYIGAGLMAFIGKYL